LTANITTLQNHELIFHSIPNAFNFDKASFKNFPKIVISDNINSFFPVSEVYFKDSLGVIPETIGFIEGLEVKLQIGNIDDGYVGGDFALVTTQMNDVVLANNLSGNTIFIFVSRHYFNNEKKTRSYKDTISNIIKNICLTDYNLDITKQFISNTIGNDYYYQGNIRTSKFIEQLSDQAYSQNNPKSPFYTFHNVNGEFYFMTINEMFAQKVINPDNPYLIKQDKDSSTNPYHIQDYWIQNLGAEENFLNYKINIFKNASDLSIDNNELDYKDHVYRDENGKILIRKQYQKVTRNVNLGLYDSTNDLNRFQGLQNTLYRNSALPTRLIMVAHLNPLLVAGKTINLEVQSNDLEKGLSKEYSGKWLCMGVKIYDDQDNIPYVEALLAKSTIYIDERHPYKKDFL
jgi:hypothetical protein